MRAYIDYGYRPHKVPASMIGPDAPAEVISWECAACGDTIREYDYQETECSVNWRYENWEARKL